MLSTNENNQATASAPEQIISVHPDEPMDPVSAADELETTRETSSRWDKKSVGKLLMIPLVVGIVVVGAAFGLPLIFSTKKEPSELPPEPTIPDPERNDEI